MYKGGQIGTLCIWAKNSWNYKENKRIFPTYLLRKFLAHVKARENSLSLTVNPVAKKQPKNNNKSSIWPSCVMYP